MLPLHSKPQSSQPHSFHPIKNSLPDHPPLPLDILFHNCDCDIERTSSLIDPILSAKSQCQLTSYYIHGIWTCQTAFLVSNLRKGEQLWVTDKGCNWLVGCDPNCAVVADPVHTALCHAVLGYSQDIGFYVTDLGSPQGTRVNRRLLSPLERYPLHHGDLLEFGNFWVEFFYYSDEAALACPEDPTHF